MMDVNGFEASNSHGEIEEIEDEIAKRFKRFSNFDRISDPPSDHHFLYYKKSTKQVVLGSALAEKVQQEWNMLETSLPNSIFVRAYENRIDLMRAVIIGPPGTPYCHGLFFFDILFPSNYPARPPKLFYHSQGLDLNPNLKPEGKVCLSLLETWYGRLIHGWYGCNNEKWNPIQSNLIQVLVSIRCLVLTAKPYLNEPVRLYVFNESEVLKYNKNAFVLTCEAMIRTLGAPPGHFEVFVAGHFRYRAHPILMSYKVHMGQSESTIQLFLKLLKAFEGNGAYCKHHLSRVKLKEETTPEERRPNNGIVSGTFNKLRYMVDLL